MLNIFNMSHKAEVQHSQIMLQYERYSVKNNKMCTCGKMLKNEEKLFVILRFWPEFVGHLAF